jgi:hypothetical protein
MTPTTTAAPRLLLVAISLILSLASRRAAADTFTEAVQAQCEAILLKASEPKGIAAALPEAQQLADFAVAWASDRQLVAVGWAEGTRHLLVAAGQDRVTDLGDLGRSPELCVELGLLLDQADRPGGAIALGQRLVAQRQDAVAAYPTLAAALCVVHDEPWTRRINENAVKAPDPLAIFDYFVRNASRLKLDPAKTPAALLVHVVDVTEDIPQLEWALATYGRNPAPGERFFEIKYDYDAFRRGVPKKVTEAGNYRLESIKQHGGVCADQAYFAESVGKAAGVPTCYVVASGADVAHAWIGFLDTRRRGGWDFNNGRYEAYQNLRGQVVSPQTRGKIADADIGLLGGLMAASLDEVRATSGAALAIVRLSQTPGRPSRFEPPATMEGVPMTATRKKARTAGVDDRLDLLKTTMTACASVPRGWHAVEVLAQQGELSRSHLDEWAQAVERMCGSVFPDFSFDTLIVLLGTEKDADAQSRMWDWAYARYRTRPDLASAARFAQARLWDRNERPDLSWIAYEEVVKNFLNDGPMCVQALREMRRLLQKNGKADSFLRYVEDAAKRVKAPGTMAGEFQTQSNHYKIHAMLADELDGAGRSGEAAKIREKVGIRK